MWLITGGAGFIGSHLIRRLSEHTDWSLALQDTLDHPAKWTYLQNARIDEYILPSQFDDRLIWIEEDLKGVIHLGAISDTKTQEGDRVIETNLQLSQTLWNICVERQIPFLYASSAATYGMGIQGFSDHEDRLHHLRPMNLYGWSKHMFDCWVSRQVQMGKTPSQWAGFKFFNVYGPHERHKGAQRSVVSVLYDALHHDHQSAARLFRSYREDIADGEQKRDFVWVEDCIDVMMWFLENPQASGLFNVGTGKARSFNDLAHAVFKALERPSAITYVDMPEGLDAHYQYYTEADLKRLRDVGYTKPFTSLEDGVMTYVQQRRLMDCSF